MARESVQGLHIITTPKVCILYAEGPYTRKEKREGERGFLHRRDASGSLNHFG